MEMETWWHVRREPESAARVVVFFSRERGKRVRDLKGQWNCSKEKGWYEYMID